MGFEGSAVRAIYKRIVSFYPRTFRDELGESMEQTFNDLYGERQRENDHGVFGFVLWTFIETMIGILREYLLLISPGDMMQALLKTTGVSTLISLLLILPLAIMEIVNRRHLNEEFPFVLFLALWLNLFAVSSILLPIMQARPTVKHDVMNPAPAPGNLLLTNPGWAAAISVVVFFLPGVLPLMESLGWLSLDRLFNGPNPEVEYLPGLFLTVGLILFPIAAGIIAGRPIVNTLRAGGSLFTHPINLIVVVVISSLFAWGVGTLIVDQWPCFIGVPVCD